MTIKSKDPNKLFQLLSDWHEANAAQLVALTAVLEHQDERIQRIEELLSSPNPARLSN